jgi:anti-sigma-K factor RskA
MAEEQQLDNKLAAFTDALLDDVQAKGSDRPPLSDTVEMLARTLGHQPLPTHLRSRVRRCVAAEWSKPQPSLSQRLGDLTGPFGQPKYRWAWAAVSALVVVAIAAALILPIGPGQTPGTLVGEIDATTLVIALGLLAAAAVVAAWLASRRR